jgi:outer membrane protein TolC
MSIAEERLRVSKEQLEAVEKRRAANLVDEVDVVRSSAAVQDATLSLKRVESLFDAKRAELAVIAQNEEIYRLLPEFDIYRVDSLPRVETAVARIENQRIVSALKVRLEQIAHEKQGLEETGKPQLYLNLIGALQDGDASFERSLGLDKPELGIALEFRHPLGGRTARADVARADFESRQLRREIESVSLSLEAEMRRLLIRIGELVEIMALNREQIETARIKTREELKLYNQGRGELIFVIQSRDDEYLAQLVYALSASQYHQLVLTYRALADELLVQ